MTESMLSSREWGEKGSQTAPADARLALIADAVPMMIWVTGPCGKGEFFNSGWLEFTGRALDDQLGAGWLAAIHPDDRSLVESTYQEPFAGRQPVEVEYRLCRDDGVYRWVLSRGVPQWSDDGGFAGFVGAALDVTDRHRIETERSKLLAETNEANSRLASLQELTARLASLTRPEEVAEVVLGQGVSELGARTGSLCLLDRDGQVLRVAAQVGYPDRVTAEWGQFPLGAPTPAGDAVRLEQAIYISSLTELDHRYPIFKGTALVGDESLAVLPLTTAGRPTLGAMVIGFAEPREFSPGDRRLLAALAAQAATALAQTESRVALELARQQAEAGREQLAYLADASNRLAASLDLADTLATVASLAIPRLADRCTLYMLSDGRVQTMMLEPTEPGVDIAAFLERYPVRLEARRGVGAVLRTGQAEFTPWVDEGILATTVRSAEQLELMRRIGFGAALILPLRARGNMVGALALTNEAGRAMSDQDRVLAEELAARAAVAIDNARLFAKQADVSHRLQASLLPPALPTIPGLDLAARYAPGGEGVEVGGDFYDCVPAGPDRWLLVVGDVRGKGVTAAALTGMARHTIRAAAFCDLEPATALRLLNRVLVSHEADRMAEGGRDWEASEPRFCTALVVALARSGRGFEATVAAAGHPLPLLRSPDGTVTSAGQCGDLLGLHQTVELAEAHVVLEPGAVLVCFTDGASECHHDGRFFGEDGIGNVLAAEGGPAESVANAIVAAARPYASSQVVKYDMAIMVARVLA
ncbi:MAG: SpoIIE family protein phosphatase [Actinomycetota bacterium]|nr:SpoIIE family protein phosphatase [Actinomycetota bacterium]